VTARHGTRDWNAASYDRVSTPQLEMALPVLDRLLLTGDETVLDAGCGSGRVTAALLERLPRGAVVAADAAPSMIDQARERFGSEPRVRVLDPVSLTELQLAEPVDAAFSNAVFHWIKDHDALFERLHAALRPGAPLAAQCGGKGNIDGFRRLADEVAAEPPYAEHMSEFAGPWNYADPAETEERLVRAGFEDARCWLEPWPVTPDEPLEYASTVCLGNHLEELPEDLREAFAAEVVRRSGEPFRLEYVRLNIMARAA
jgi:trans-aconitate 2-methyltransferase